MDCSLYLTGDIPSINKKFYHSFAMVNFFGAAEGIRTPNLSVRSRMLHPIKLQLHNNIIIQFLFNFFNSFYNFILFFTKFDSSYLRCYTIYNILLSFKQQLFYFQEEDYHARISFCTV